MVIAFEVLGAYQAFQSVQSVQSVQSRSNVSKTFKRDNFITICSILMFYSAETCHSASMLLHLWYSTYYYPVIHTMIINNIEINDKFELELKITHNLFRYGVAAGPQLS